MLTWTWDASENIEITMHKSNQKKLKKNQMCAEKYCFYTHISRPQISLGVSNTCICVTPQSLGKTKGQSNK